MTYRKGDCIISVEQINGCGKKKSLFVGTENELIKVASFVNDDRANVFCKWFEYFLGNKQVEGADVH